MNGHGTDEDDEIRNFHVEDVYRTKSFRCQNSGHPSVTDRVTFAPCGQF
jgi:hypothetical protein